MSTQPLTNPSLMKTLIRMFGVLVLVTQSQAQTAASSSPTEVDKLARETVAELNKVPELKDQWPAHPVEFRKRLESVAATLAKEEDASSKQALVDLFANTSRAPLPKDPEAASECLDQKREAVLYGLNYPVNRQDKKALLAMSDFLGDVRAKIIPDFQDQSTGHPGMEILVKAGVFGAEDLKNPKQIQEYQEAVKANNRAKAESQFQASLFQTEQILVAHLIHSSLRYATRDPEDQDFLRKVVSHGRLTASERGALGVIMAER